MVTNHRILKKTGKKRILRHKNLEQSLMPEFELYSTITPTESDQILSIAQWQRQCYTNMENEACFIEAKLDCSFITSEDLSRKEERELEKNCYQTK